MTDRADDSPAGGPMVMAMQRRRSAIPTPSLRGRVLAAIDDALQSGAPSALTVVDGRPWVVAGALVAGLLLPVWLASAARRPPASQSAVVAFLAERALAAGVDATAPLPFHSPLSRPRLASPPTRVDDSRSDPAHFHPLVFRRELEGDF